MTLIIKRWVVIDATILSSANIRIVNNMSVTFKDVAILAGVSTQTVSRVTNGATNVAEDTKKKVMAAIEELGYIPNKGAQLLSRAKANVIGLITLDIGLHGVSMIANGIRNQSSIRGYGTSFSVVLEPNYENILKGVRELISQKTEIIIVNVPMNQEDAESLIIQHADIHFVFIDVPTSAKVNMVCSTHFAGGCSAAQLMLAQRRTQYLLISGPNDSSASSLRVKGWTETLKDSGATISALYEGDWQASSGYLLTRQAITEGIPFDAVLIASDQMALGSLRALDEFSLSVPDQVAIIGFDDTLDCAYFTPPLSTVRQDFEAIGKMAVELALDEHLENRNSKKEFVDTYVVERKTTGEKSAHPYDKKGIKTLLNEIERRLP